MNYISEGRRGGWNPPRGLMRVVLLTLTLLGAGAGGEGPTGTGVRQSVDQGSKPPRLSRHHVEDHTRPRALLSAEAILEAHGETFRAFYDTLDVLNATEAATPLECPRSLKSIVSPRPSFIPGPGSFMTAVGVEVRAAQGDMIRLTVKVVNDLFHPNGTVLDVPSGHILHVDRPTTLTAYTLSRNGSLAGDSPKVTGSYNVPYRQYGSAYLVPYHNAAPGFSGKLVRVNLETDLLSYVRIHNVLTDFADYYSFKGQAPYGKGHLHVNDLAGIDPALAGFQGGFSGRCGGKSYGFLAPFFNGRAYSGKAVRIQTNNFLNVTSSKRCNRTVCAVDLLDLSAADSTLRGFSGGFMSGCYAYFVPYFNGRQFASKVVRVHAVNFTQGNVTTIDLRKADTALAGFFGGFAHGDYGYLAPFRNIKGPVGGVNTRFTCDGFKDVDMVSTQATNGGDHLQPNMFGKLVRFRLSNFSSANVEVLDLTKYDPDLRGFSGAFAVGNQAILVPYRNRELVNNQGFFSKVVKVDMTDFKTVHVLDLSHVDQSLRGFVGGFAYGKYAILVPYSNGRVTSNWQGRSEFGTVVRIDVNDFQADKVRTLDLPTVHRQQVPSFPVAQLRGFVQGFASGKHGYLVPYFNGVRSGLLTRLDMEDFERLSLLQAAGNSTDVYGMKDGVQIVDLAQYDKGLAGFSGGFAAP